MYDIACPKCGAYAMELPDESGRTWCAACGVEYRPKRKRKKRAKR